MIRVAFQLNFRDRSWMGGVNYFNNLFEALRLLPSRQIEPVIFAGDQADSGILESFGVQEIHTSKWIDHDCWLGRIRRSILLGFGRDVLFEQGLKSNKIDLYSHIGYLGKNARIPSLTWIPDFQERYFPEFFSPLELSARDRSNRRIVKHASAILLSSEHARDGLAGISPKAARDAYVLPFVASVPSLSEMPTLEFLERQYGFLGEYFFLPNQFWAHKNHEVVLHAISLLKQQGKSITVIATGNIHDHRQPLHGERLVKLVAELDLIQNFRSLGIVPYTDLMALMANSIAVLNPSLFEGWSTTVEEAKSLGKMVVASDIPVHREQSPNRVVFFDPHNPANLADTLSAVMIGYNKNQDLVAMRAAEIQLPARRLAFAHQYEMIVNKVISH